jgi:hypothetical protein
MAIDKSDNADLAHYRSVANPRVSRIDRAPMAQRAPGRVRELRAWRFSARSRLIEIPRGFEGIDVTPR